MKFYRCNKCGKILTILEDSGQPTVCCGEAMEEIKAQSYDETYMDRHVPVIKRWGEKVCINIGEEIHPCNTKHHINFVAVEYENGFIIKYLKCDEQPIIKFKLCKCLKIKAVYCYCNLHGLWVKEVK